jgi:predicted phosphodiesterase
MMHARSIKIFAGIVSFFLLAYPLGAWSGKTEAPVFLVAPYLGRPTASSITMNLVAGEKDLVCHVKFRTGNRPWQQTPDMKISARSPRDIKLESLTPGRPYRYEVYARAKGKAKFKLVAEDSFRSKSRQAGPFAFAIVSDSHITPGYPERSRVLAEVNAAIGERKPDFLMMLGDNIQAFTSYGGPMAKPDHGPLLYLMLREAMGDLPTAVPVFIANGNWDGENGWHPDRERKWAREARMAYVPNPDDTTYPESGSKDQDYYAFTWGDVLCMVLNVTGYTPADHSLTSPVGRPNDWTLGEAQKAWLYQKLSKSTAKWKLLFIHHTVGGSAGDDVNSRYGRGGGQAAGTGEQAQIHQWMIEFGVQALFYGHDHVFTDITVDRIHYICVGSAGAPWKFSQSDTGYEKYWTPSGYTWVDVGTDTLRVSFIRPDPQFAEGTVLHTFDLVSR